jgi:hypothetical protein
MSQNGYFDQVLFSNIAATPAAFKLNGGSYGLTMTAAMGRRLESTSSAFPPDGSTYVSVLTTTFTANAFQTVNVPPGTYQLTVTTATAVYADITSVYSAVA